MNKGIKIAVIIVLAVMLVAVAVLFAARAGRDAVDEPVVPVTEPKQDVSSTTPDVELPALSRSKVGWGIGAGTNEKNQPTDAIAAQKQYGYLGAQFIFPDDTGVMYLTFDLGYENGYTEQILDALDARGVKATFFITMDYANDAPDIVRRIIQTGHTLANHTVKHPSIPDVSDARTSSEVLDLHTYIQDNFGYEMHLFRYPMGEYSEHSLNYINELGYKSIFWSFAYVDWKTDAQPGHAQALERVTSSMHDGAIYLLHAVSSTNAAIMGDFLDAAHTAGYQFKLIDERLGLVEEREPRILP